MTEFELPIIDVEPLILGTDVQGVAHQIGTVCREYGFFYISGHGIHLKLQDDLVAVSREFFALEQEEKMKVRMELGGRAWRGYFPVGDELTSGKADLKEGYYFGQELDDSDQRVIDGLPLHGPNLFSGHVPKFKTTVLEYMQQLTHLSHRLMEALSVGLGLQPTYFYDHYTKDPLTLFRVFHYPPQQNGIGENWGVGEHTDYGVLTILKQDTIGGLQVRSKGNWIDAPPIENTFVCNIGDMLDKLTGGLYHSTPHRVLNTSGKGRLSFPFFFDPNWNARIAPVIDLDSTKLAERWDKADIHGYQGTYGEYILEKVAKVFPDLKSQ